MFINHLGPIIIIEDDLDDQEMVITVLKELKAQNHLVFFTNPLDAFAYLKKTEEPLFLIICDINLPVMNGMELKRRIDEDEQLREKSIPFIFFSTSADEKTVKEAYTRLTVQGFFKKCNSLKDLEQTISTILNYWKLCRHPNSL